jgi:heat shock protein HtpX
MNFWAAQAKAKRRTKYLLLAFIAILFIVGYGADEILRFNYPKDYRTPYPLFGLAMASVILLVALSQFMGFKAQGGGFVARQAGGRRIFAHHADFKERQLLNIVEEMALAAALPLPEIYVIDGRKELNAFAAGLTQNTAAIAITEGALHAFTRDELQGVIAHELGHIYNKDMRISMYLAAMLAGLFFLVVWGYKLFYYSSASQRVSKEGRNETPIVVVIALLLTLSGAITWFLGLILRAMISREREYLADASSVQFTRTTEGLCNALRKIERSTVRDMPASEMAYSHLYFNPTSLMDSLFATHPPVKKRIKALEGGTYTSET